MFVSRAVYDYLLSFSHIIRFKVIFKEHFTEHTEVNFQISNHEAAKLNILDPANNLALDKTR